MDWGMSGSETERTLCSSACVWLRLWGSGSLPLELVEPDFPSWVCRSCLFRQMADFSYEVYGAGGEDDPIGWGDGSGLVEGRGEVWGGFGWNVERVGCGEEVF